MGVYTTNSGETDSKFLLRWYLLPALFWLMAVTTSGTIIRFLWAYPGHFLWDAKHLTHAHSHVALLGWAWNVAVAYLIKNHMQHWLRRRGILRVYAIAVFGANMGMLITFPMGGYWKWSIFFSAAHVVLSLIFMIAYALDRRHHVTKHSSLAFDAALLWGAVANLAPLALALGNRVGGAGITVIVNGYVHLQCFGFLALFLAGMAYDTILRRRMMRESRRQGLALRLLIFGVFPAQIVAVRHLLPGHLPIWVGAAGMSIYDFGLWIFLFELVSRWPVMRRTGCHRPVWTAMIGLAVLAFLLAGASIPPLAENFSQARYLVIGVLHLLLLGLVTPVFLGYVHSEAELRIRQIRIPVLVFVISVWSMIFFLILGGLAQGMAWVLPFNIAFVLFYVAVPVMLATCWLFALVIGASLSAERIP